MLKVELDAISGISGGRVLGDLEAGLKSMSRC